jgi:capsular exopolysaccharide synthesis family protein
MSRILEALRKSDAGGAATPAERPRYTAPAAAEPRPAEPPLEAPAQAPATSMQAPAIPVPTPWPTAPPLPSIPEGFRPELAGLRLHLETALAGRQPRVVLMTSSAHGEGTTTVAASFARVVAQDPSVRVLLVDANLRRPTVGTYFGVGPRPGLAEILSGAAVPDGLAVPADQGNLHVLAATGDATRAATAFAPASVRQFLNEVGTAYDWVIFDAPPVLESPETAVLGGVVDTTVLVVRAARTKGGVAQRAIDQLVKAGVPVLGVVLNRRRHDIPEFIYRRV